MATNVTFNGNTYSVPQVGDSGWGSSLTNYLVAIASGALQKTGGAYTLSAEVDFGTGFGLKSLYFKSRGASVSSTGIVRMANAESIAWRNAANSADLALTVNSSDELQFGGANVIVGGLGTITNSDISASAAIAFSKLAPLANGTVLMGSPSNVAASYTLDGDVLVGPGGTTSINAGVIVNADINASAAIARSKLDFGSGLVNADLSSSAAIALSKLAAVTASRALVSDGSGFVSASSVTATELGRLSGLGSAALGLTDTQSPTNKTFNDTSNVVLVGGNSRGAAMRVGTNDAASLFLETNGVDRFQLMDTANLSTGDAGFFGTAGLIVPAGTTAQRPSSPSNGTIRLNTDTGEFEGRAAGAWQSVGGGVNERPEKNYLKSYATAAVAPGTLATLASGTANIATTSGLFHADSGSGSAALTQSSDTSLRGASNYYTTAFSSSSAGAVFVQFPAFALEAADLGKPVSISFDVTGVTTSGDWDVVVVRYNASGTYQELIPVAGTASGASVTPSARLPTGTAQFRGFFVPTSDSGHLYALRFRRLAGSAQIRLDTLYVGPQAQLSGAPVTDWQSYSPTVANLGTGTYNEATSSKFVYRRVGDSLEYYFRMQMTNAGSGASEVTISLPSGLTIDTTKGSASGNQDYGRAVLVLGAGTSSSYHVIENGNVLRFYDQEGTWGGLTGATLTNSSVLWARGIVPIANWSSNTTMAERAVESYAADDGSADVFGPNGAAIPSITQGTGTTSRSFAFQDTFQATDFFSLEIQTAAGRAWLPMATAFPFLQTAANDFYGAQLDMSGAAFSVLFGNRGYAPTAGIGSNSTVNWQTSWRYRVRKVSSGAAIGGAIGARNVVGDTSGTAVPAGYLGEQIRSQTTVSNSLVNNTPETIVSITLTPGTWDLSAVAEFDGSPTGTQVVAGIGTTNNSLAGQVQGDNQVSLPLMPTASSDVSISIPQFRVNVATSTVYYLVVRALFSAGSIGAFGRLSAVRVG